MEACTVFLVIGAILVGYSYMLSCYWSLAHPGINQNGYLVGGKNLAEYGTMGMKLKEPYEHFGWMWNLVDRKDRGTEGRHLVLSEISDRHEALFAACLKVSQWTYDDWEAGKIWSFYVNPVGAVLAMRRDLLARAARSPVRLRRLRALIFGCCQVLLSFADQPLSHGPALAW